jgi:S-adenosylmethionine:tRNA ribosyltransferase-isomerase
VLELRGGGSVTVEGREGDDGVMIVRFDRPAPTVMEEQGEMPLPPYLDRLDAPEDRERYQPVDAGPRGAAAAPTAGLHFTRSLLEDLEAVGIRHATVTLHVGIGTFRPVRPEDLARGRLHPEQFDIPERTALAIAETQREKGRIIAVGTTSARALESATPPGERAPLARSGVTELFIQPPCEFRCIDGLITNFHLPRSSLLLLVGALVGRDRLLAAYAEAVRDGYRFYSYGDAMLLV